MANNPPCANSVDQHSAQHVWIWRKLVGDEPLIVQGDGGGIKIEYDRAKAQIKLSAASKQAAGNGGFRGEYDPTLSYNEGETFKISPYVPLVISGTTITAGLYAIRAASGSVDSQTFGPWAGYLPANPSTSGIDLDKLFFNPDATFPTLGASPNDKLYAELVGKYC